MPPEQIVNVVYFVAGIPGAIAGWLAMRTPALLVVRWFTSRGRHIINRPRVKAVLQAVVIAIAGLLLAASIPLARDALTAIAIAAVSLMLLLLTETDTLWIILGAAIVYLSASSLGLIDALHNG